MKKLFVFAAFAIGLAAMSFTHTTNYSVDTAASNIVWKGYKVTGEHTGNVKVKSGSFITDHGKILGGSFLIDMNSIACTDLQGEYGDKLVGHLKADDFFGVAKFPTSELVLTRVSPVDSKGNYRVVANLTIKEKTREVKFNANITEAAGALTATGKIVVDRSDFDIKYGSGSFFDGLGDKTIYDEFDLTVNIVAKM